MIRYGQFCPVAKTAEIFGDRWSPLIVRELCYGPRSYGDFLAAIPLISRTMLSQRLKELAAAGVVQPDPKQKGRGLGLFIVQQLLDTENCTISLSSRRNERERRFRFTLDFAGAIDGTK